MSTINSVTNKEIASLITKIESLIAELKNSDVSNDSIEFYLLNNLVKYRQSLVAANSKQDIENAASIFGRFCTESMDWETKDYQKYIQLSEKGYAITRGFANKATHSI